MRKYFFFRSKLLIVERSSRSKLFRNLRPHWDVKTLTTKIRILMRKGSKTQVWMREEPWLQIYPWTLIHTLKWYSRLIHLFLTHSINFILFLVNGLFIIFFFSNRGKVPCQDHPLVPILSPLKEVLSISSPAHKSVSLNELPF